MVLLFPYKFTPESDSLYHVLIRSFTTFTTTYIKPLLSLCSGIYFVKMTLIPNPLHKPATIWFTGLSGSGKSTIAQMLRKKLSEQNIHAYILDGDTLRRGLNADLGFSPEHRAENLRRVAEVARLMNDAGIVVIVALISPYVKDRAHAAQILGPAFHEVFVDASLETCMQRDPKGVYARFRAGEIKDLTGIDAPYQPPVNPALHLRTGNESAEASTQKVLNLVVHAISPHRE